MKITKLLCLAALTAASTSQAAMRITEWAYAAGTGEYVELTNVGLAPIDMAGFVYDDDSRINTVAGGAFDLSGFGTVAPGESVVFTENTSVDDFRLYWSLDPSVKVLGSVANNLGRNDEINIYDNAGVLVDRLTFGDQNFPGSFRTQNISANPASLAVVGANSVVQWVASANGDAFGSYDSLLGDVGNPGVFALYQAVPEPTSAVLVLLGLAACARRVHG